jgi:hypothetical protein
MSMVTLPQAEGKYSQAERPNRGSSWAGETFQRLGFTAKGVRDPLMGEVWVVRYRGYRCRWTFRHYPVGVYRASQALLMRALAAFGRRIGMSYLLLSSFSRWIILKPMSIWRDVQRFPKQLER